MPAHTERLGRSKARLLFLYGTLMKHVACGRPARLVAALDDGVAAWARGSLFAVREGRVVYPALVIRGCGTVKGFLYRLPQDPRWLAALDRFENYDPRRPHLGDYVRQEIEVKLGDGRMARADAYIYRRPIRSGLRLIRHGDFVRHLRETGLRPYGR